MTQYEISKLKKQLFNFLCSKFAGKNQYIEIYKSGDSFEGFVSHKPILYDGKSFPLTFPLTYSTGIPGLGELKIYCLQKARFSNEGMQFQFDIQIEKLIVSTEIKRLKKESESLQKEKYFKDHSIEKIISTVYLKNGKQIELNMSAESYKIEKCDLKFLDKKFKKTFFNKRRSVHNIVKKYLEQLLKLRWA